MNGSSHLSDHEMLAYEAEGRPPFTSYYTDEDSDDSEDL